MLGCASSGYIRNCGLKSTVFKCQQISISVIYMHCLNTACPPGYHHNDFIETGPLRKVFKLK